MHTLVAYNDTLSTGLILGRVPFDLRSLPSLDGKLVGANSIMLVLCIRQYLLR